MVAEKSTATANDGVFTSHITDVIINGGSTTTEVHSEIITQSAASAVATNFQSDAKGAASSLSTITQSTPLALTTIYTPPASCSSLVTWDGTSLWQYGVNQTGGDCYPPDFRLIFNSYYTPGICPDQWTSAGTIRHSSGFDAMCCPRGFFLSASTGYACASFFSNVLRNVYSTSAAGNEPIPSGASLTTTDATNGVATVIADVIQIQWQATDQKIINLMSARNSPSQTGQAARTGSRKTSPAASPTASPTASPIAGAQASNYSSGGLSTGAKIGIGIAIPLVVLTLLGMGLFFLFRRRKARATRQDEPSVEAKRPGSQELSRYEQNQQTYHNPRDQQPQEMQAQELNELPADRAMTEIGGREMQRSTAFKESAIMDSQYKDRSFQESSPRMPTKKILR